MNEKDREANEEYLQKILNEINSSKNIPDKNKKAIKDYYTYIRGKGVKLRTKVLYFYSLKYFFEALGKVQYDKATRDDINEALAKIQDLSNLNERTKAEIKSNMKQFYKHAVGEDEYMPRVVSHIKVADPKNVLHPQDILTEDDVIKMLNVANSIRDRAIIATLYDTGARVGELLNVKLNDISLDTTPARIKLIGKTGERSVPIYFCVPYLTAYLDTVKGELKKDESIWRKDKRWVGFDVNPKNGKENEKKRREVHQDGEVSYDAVRFTLTDAGERAKIKKRTNPHAFRHARATFLAKKYTEQELKMHMGWTAGSEMAQVYVHLDTRDLDTAFLKASGAPIPEDRKDETKLKNVTCPNCKFVNMMDAPYCLKCHMPLKAELVGVTQETEDRIRKLENVILKQMGYEKMVNQEEQFADYRGHEGELTRVHYRRKNRGNRIEEQRITEENGPELKKLEKEYLKAKKGVSDKK